MSTNRPVPNRVRQTVPPDHDGQRLDLFLAGTLDLSRSRFQALAREGRVRVDGIVRKPSFALNAGSIVEVEVPPPRPSHLVGQEIELSLLYEDEHIVVVNKPPGLVVHPGAGNPDRTLVNALVHRFPDMEGVGGVRRPGLVHRLDKDTSGALVVAKTEPAFAALTLAMAERRIERTYRAVVWGHPGSEGRIDAPIGRDRSNRTRMAVRPEGREATTLYRVIARFDFFSLVELTLLTGRTHQIRVHLSHIGIPIVGDPVYGGRRHGLWRLAPESRRLAKPALDLIDRQALHAWRLSFRHPMTDRPLSFEAPEPDDFDALVAWMRQGDQTGFTGEDE